MNCEKLKKYPQNSPYFKKLFGGINADLLRFIAIFLYVFGSRLGDGYSGQ